MTENATKKNDLTPEYQMTERDLAAIAKHREARERHETSPNIKVLKDGTSITLNHPHPAAGYARLMDALGTTNHDFYHGILTQLANSAQRDGKIVEEDLNFLLSVVKGIKPRDQNEVMLAAQMAATHRLIMSEARKLSQCKTEQQCDSVASRMTKLSRTFAAQMETLKRYRSSAEPKVIVQQVSVSDRAQAIVGNVTQTPREVPQGEAVTSPRDITNAGTAPKTINENLELTASASPSGEGDDEQSST